MQIRCHRSEVRDQSWDSSLDFFPSPSGHWIAAFVEFDVVDKGFDRFAGETAFLDALGKDVAAFVAPAKLGDEAIPDVAFFVGARRAVGVRPIQNGFVGLAGEHMALDFRVGNAEKTATASVEGKEFLIAEVIVVRGRESARRVEADFVQHPPEINEPSNLVVTTPQTGNVRHEQTLVRVGPIASFVDPPAGRANIRPFFARRKCERAGTRSRVRTRRELRR